MQLDHQKVSKVNSIKPAYKRHVLSNHKPQQDSDFLLRKECLFVDYF